MQKKDFILSLLCAVFLLFNAGSYALPQSIVNYRDHARLYLLNNLSVPNAKPGSVVASPSTDSPNYYYHWIRDAALVMREVVIWHEQPDSSEQSEYLAKQIHQYIDWVDFLQHQPTPSHSIAEPKFELNGQAFTGPWARPQADGPALRASTLIRYAEYLLANGDTSGLLARLYKAAMPADSIIKRDLEFTAHHWQDTSFDLWEEISGHHFYTMMVQRKALLDGAEFARLMNDPGAADFYQQQAQAIAAFLEHFWDAQSELIKPTIDRDAGIDYKHSNLDVAVLLAVLHASPGLYESYNVLDTRVLHSIVQLTERFALDYPLNDTSESGIAIGRYPEDVYDGVGFSGGNPWFLATNALGEFFLRHLHALQLRHGVAITENNIQFYQWIFTLTHHGVPGWLKAGLEIASDSPEFKVLSDRLIDASRAQFTCTRYHAKEGDHLSEQMNRVSGLQQGAHDLTWSYASVLSYVRAEQVLN